MPSNKIIKRISLTNAQRRQLCLDKEKKPTPTAGELASKYGIKEKTVSAVLLAKEKWLATNSNEYTAQLKRNRPSKYENVERALWSWVKGALSSSLDINGAVLKKKAIGFAMLLSIEGFKASDGWIAKFKKKYNLREYTKHGEAKSAPSDEAIMQERLRVSQIISEYSLDDVWNADETGLFWKMDPARTLATGPLAGKKKNKERVTLLVACSLTGEKLPAVFVHKWKQPMCLRGINHNSLPVWYYWNKKSWMQISIFNDWLERFDGEMRRCRRNILLLLDNAPVHAVLPTTNLTNIRVEFFAPNMTSVLQPCDAGVINSFKVRVI